METRIDWIEGTGAITATYTGSGNGSAVITSDVNEGIDREQTINVSTTEGTNPKSIDVRVKQYGLRETFELTDGTLTLAGNGNYNVLKQ